MVTARLGPVLVSVLLLTGCADGGSSEADGDRSPAASPASGSTASEDPPTATPSSAARTVPFPDVPPASGPKVQQASIVFRAPDGWRPESAMATNQSVAAGPGLEYLTLFEQTAMGGELPLDRDAEIALRNLAGEGDVERLPDVEMDGQLFYRLAGPTGGTEWFEQLGTVRNGKLINLTFELDRNGAYGEQPQLVESVLNTVEWR